MSDLVQTLYISAPVRGLTLHDVDRVVAEARVYNRSQGITGLLLVTVKGAGLVHAFMQWIEGAPGPVQTCTDRIFSDPRHTDILLVHSEPVTTRSYPKWSMHLEHVSMEETQAAWDEHGIQPGSAFLGRC